MIRTRDNTETKYFIEGEVLRRPWIDANKEAAPRDIIAALRDESRPGKPLTRRSDVMTNLMRKYHDDLQNKDPIENLQRYKEDTKAVLSHIKSKLRKEHYDLLAERLTTTEVQKAIESLPNGKAAGSDGIPQEIWKDLLQPTERGNEDTEECVTETKDTSDIADYFTILFNDIEEYGIMQNTGFSDGWLCPIYKKGNRTDAGNYRPITILNSDYKTLTKALTNRLMEAVPNLIHLDQAGFMKGRRIEDQTELANLILAWGEKKGVNDIIMCLDQEKAYDRVRHEFLWATLKKFGFPRHFINTVKALYKNAETIDILNGEKSTPFQVKRGVRQGDPMSCLLFNLVIESLAQMLKSSDLEGIEINNNMERLIAKLFVDDTTVYLSENDDIKDLQDILEKWCKASGGKFNDPKTVIVPIGGEAFRKDLIENRMTKGSRTKIPEEIRIAKDGESTRLLGSFIGNKVDSPSIWSPTLEKITKDLDQWNKGHPTIDGHRLVIGMVVGGRTQYRACVRGMPPEIELRLTRMIRNFIWGGGEITHPTVGMETLIRPIEEGGKKLLDIKTRNEAIELMKAKRFLDLSETRPTWAKIADSLIHISLKKKWKLQDDGTYHNIFLQTLTASTREGERGLPHSLRSMLNTAKKHKLSVSPVNIKPKPKLDMPIWYHAGMADLKNPGYNTIAAKCH